MKINKKLLTSLIILTSVSSVAFAFDTNAALGQGIADYKNSNYIACLQNMAAVLSDDPSNVLAHYYMGMSNIQLGETTKGEESYKKVILLNTNEHLTKLAKAGLTGMEIAKFEEQQKEADENKVIADAKKESNKQLEKIKKAQDEERLLKTLEDNIREAKKDSEPLSPTAKKIQLANEELKAIVERKAKATKEAAELSKIEAEISEIENREPNVKTSTSAKIETAREHLKKLKELELKESTQKTISGSQIEYLYKKDKSHFATPSSESKIRQVELDNLKTDFNDGVFKNDTNQEEDEDKKKMNP